MANKNLFSRLAARLAGARAPLLEPDARNGAGAPATPFDAGHARAQYATTGCLNGTFYATAEAQLEDVLRLCDAVPAERIAKTAVYARERGFMKDLPALLVAYLSVADADLCARV